MVQQQVDPKQQAAQALEGTALAYLASSSRSSLPYTICFDGPVVVVAFQAGAPVDMQSAARELFAVQDVPAQQHGERVSMKGTMNGTEVLVDLDLGDGRGARDQYLALTRKIKEMPELRGVLRNHRGEVCGTVCEAKTVPTLADAMREHRLSTVQLEGSVRALLHRAAAAGLRCWNLRPDSFGIDSNDHLVALASDAFMPVEIAGTPRIERDVARVCEAVSSASCREGPRR